MRLNGVLPRNLKREGGSIKLLESRENDCAVPAVHEPYLTV